MDNLKIERACQKGLCGEQKLDDPDAEVLT